MRLLTILSISSLIGPCLTQQSVAQGQAKTEVYSGKMVLFVSPDSTGLQMLEKRLGDDFYVIADDENWYRSEAFSLLDSLKIEYKFVDRCPMRFIVDGEEREYDWKNVKADWFIILYDGKREPKVSASIDLPVDIDYLLP